MTSGAIYLMVPTALVRVCSIFFAVPKSHSLRTLPLSNNSMLGKEGRREGGREGGREGRGGER